jgi:hypothetical protein
MENCHVKYDTQLASKEMNVECQVSTAEMQKESWLPWVQSKKGLSLLTLAPNICCLCLSSKCSLLLLRKLPLPGGLSFYISSSHLIDHPSWQVLWKWSVLVKYLQIVLWIYMQTVNVQSMQCYVVFTMELNIMPYEKFSIKLVS